MSIIGGKRGFRDDPPNGLIPFEPKRSLEGFGLGSSLGDDDDVAEGWLAGDTAEADAARGAMSPTNGVAPVLKALNLGSKLGENPFLGALK